MKTSKEKWMELQALRADMLIAFGKMGGLRESISKDWQVKHGLDKAYERLASSVAVMADAIEAAEEMGWNK